MKIDQSYTSRARPVARPKARPIRHRESAPKPTISAATVARALPGAMRDAVSKAIVPLSDAMRHLDSAIRDNVEDMDAIRRMRQADAAFQARRERSTPASVQASNAARWPRHGQR